MKRPPKQHTRPDLSTWWNKETTATALNVSTKTVERLALNGDIESRMYKDPDGGPVHRVYHPADVEAIRKKAQPDAQPFVLPAETKALTRSAAAPAPAAPATSWEHALAVQIAKAGQLFLEAEHHPAELPVTEVLFLTIEQAAKLSGLPRSLIRQMPGIKTGRGWRIRRADLEALEVPDVVRLMCDKEQRDREKAARRQTAQELPKAFDQEFADEETGLPPHMVEDDPDTAEPARQPSYQQVAEATAAVLRDRIDALYKIEQNS